MNPEIQAKLENIRESLVWFEDLIYAEKQYSAAGILEDVIKQTESLLSSVQDRNNQGN